MNTQMAEAEVLPEQLVGAWRSMVPSERQQLLLFAEFLVQQRGLLKPQAIEVATGNWVDAIAGSFADDAEFDEVLRCGREFRQSDRPDESEDV